MSAYVSVVDHPCVKLCLQPFCPDIDATPAANNIFLESKQYIYWYYCTWRRECMIAKMTCLCFVKIIIVNFRDSKTNDPDVHNWNSEIFQYLNVRVSQTIFIWLLRTVPGTVQLYWIVTHSLIDGDNNSVRSVRGLDLQVHFWPR